MLRNENTQITNPLRENPRPEWWYMVPSKPGQNVHFLFTLAENMGVTEGNAEIRTMDDATQVSALSPVKNTLGDFSHLVTGDRGICVKVNGIYYAVHPEDGKTGAHVFVLTSGLPNVIGATGTATVLVSGEDSVAVSDTITVYNTGEKLGFAGAEGLAIKVGDEYWVAELNQLPIRMQVVLSADTHYMSPVGNYIGKSADRLTPHVSVSAAVSTTPYPFSFLTTPLTEITNPYNLIGLTGDNGIVTYNKSAGELQLVEILPAVKLRVRFKLTADMPTDIITSTMDYVPIESRQFTSGEMPHLPFPPTAPIYDPMFYVINGKADDEGIIEYSYRDQVWQVTSFRRRERGQKIFFTIDSAEVATSGSPYNGLKVLTVTLIVEPCDEDIETAEVIDWSVCLANPEDNAALVGRQGWAFWGQGRQSRASGAATGEKTPCHWVLDGLCCP